MDDAQYQAFLGLLEALIWPAFILAILFAFRSEVSAALKRIASVKFPGGEVTFEQELRVIQDEITAEGNAPAAQPRVSVDPRLTLFRAKQRGRIETDEKDYDELVDINPAAAVIAKWALVESAVRRLAIARDVGARQPSAIIEALHAEGVLSDRLVSILFSLRGLRNSAAHNGSGITKAMAINFRETADRAIRLLASKAD